MRHPSMSSVALALLAVAVVVSSTEITSSTTTEGGLEFPVEKPAGEGKMSCLNFVLRSRAGSCDA